MPDFGEYLSQLDPTTKKLNKADNILNDIDLLYGLSSNTFNVFGEEVIENMMYNVIYTPVGSRWWEPEFGSNCLQIIQEPLDERTCDDIERELFASFKRWVPYATLIFKQTYVVPYPDQNLARAFINYVDIFKNLRQSTRIDIIRSNVG